MGYFRFRRSFKLFPGRAYKSQQVGRLHAIGRRGLWFTIGGRGTRETVGIPGTGLAKRSSNPLPRRVSAKASKSDPNAAASQFGAFYS
jgi:hypothetical protein